MIIVRLTSVRTGAVAWLDRTAVPREHMEHAFPNEHDAYNAIVDFSMSILMCTGRCAWRADLLTIEEYRALTK